MATAVKKDPKEVKEAAEEVVAATEELATVIEEVVDWRLVGVGVVIGALVGGGVSYLIARKRLETKYNDIMTEEVERLREHFANKERAPKPELKEVVEELGYSAPTTVESTAAEIAAPVPPPPVVMAPDTPPAPTDVSKNVFENTDVWDYADEIRGRDPNYPYVIHIDEHRETPDGYDQHTWTYFEGDDVLTSEEDEVIRKVDEKIGTANLSKFGHGSNDPNVVYIRNEQLETDYEIIRSHGHYAVEVLGLENPGELTHEDRRRFDDD